MADDLKKGDHVTWKSHGGTAEGTVEKKITEDTEAAGRTVARFRDRNLFFGGCQAVERDGVTGALSGGCDPRRGGAVVIA